MASKTLLDYLRVVLRLETECRTLAVSMDRNRKQAATLSREQIVKKPYYAAPDNISLLVGIGCLAIAGYLIHCAIDVRKFSIVSLFFILIFAVPGIFFIWGYISSEKSTAEQNKKMREQYNNAVAANERQMAINQTNLVTVNQDYTILQNRYQETSSILSKYYNLDIVYPKYRTLPAIAMFVQYLESGRCSQLQGHDGCYNLYEDELRHDIIIAKLDEVIARLDDIRDSQYKLSNAIRQSNQQIMRLSNHIDITNQHLAVQSYNSQQAAWNTQILGEYIMFRDLVGR